MKTYAGENTLSAFSAIVKKAIAEAGGGTGGASAGGVPSGGITGQALLKASDADRDVQWGSVGNVQSVSVQIIAALTEEEYTALTTKDPATLYLIKEQV